MSLDILKDQAGSILALAFGWLIGRRREKSETGKTDAETRQTDQTTWQQRFDYQQKMIESLQKDYYELHAQFLEIQKKYVALATIAVNHGWKLPPGIGAANGHDNSPRHHSAAGSPTDATRRDNSRTKGKERRQRRRQPKDKLPNSGANDSQPADSSQGSNQPG